MSILDILESRGLLQDITNRADADLQLRTPQRVYVGFDPTGESLHVGHLLPVMALAWFQRRGHVPVAVIGGATAMIGDPSGRSEERPLLRKEEVDFNANLIREQLTALIRFEGDDPAIMVNNADWIQDTPVLDFLRDVGRNFSIPYMLSKESVRRRMTEQEEGISYTEFSYMLLQAFDFLHLFRTQGCRFQGGGSDQWGNILAGKDLIKKAESEETFGITFPLVASSSGEKFGKSLGEAVWLDPEMTPPYQFYQYWVRTDDRDVKRYLKLFTFLDLHVIEEICGAHARKPEKRLAQQRLAREVTRLIHGEKGLSRAVRASELLFRGQVGGITDSELKAILPDVPSTTLSQGDLDNGIAILGLLTGCGAAESQSEARRLVRGGGVYLNHVRVSEWDRQVSRGDLLTESALILRVGKKARYVIWFG